MSAEFRGGVVESFFKELVESWHYDADNKVFIVHFHEEPGPYNEMLGFAFKVFDKIGAEIITDAEIRPVQSYCIPNGSFRHLKIRIPPEMVNPHSIFFFSICDTNGLSCVKAKGFLLK